MQHNLICVKWGELYSRDYVNNLYASARANTTFDFSFHVFTDDIDIGKLNPSWIIHPLPNWNLPQNKAWFYKMEIFNPVYELAGRNLFLDLDVIVCNNINELWEYHTDKFVICQDFNRVFNPNYNHANSSVMSWNANNMHDMYQQFVEERTQITHKLRGDQDFIDKFIQENRIWFPSNWVMSYRWEILRGGLRTRDHYRLTEERSVIPADCKIIAFHGRPKPHEITEELLLKHWHTA